MANWLGYPYPVVKGPNGYFGGSNGVNQIKSDLLILLLTYPGERCMLPSFGTPLKDLIFEPNDSTIATRARQMIIDSIKAWEPRIAVDQISVTTTVPQNYLASDDDQTQTKAILSIMINFRDPGVITESQSLVLDIPLPGG